MILFITLSLMYIVNYCGDALEYKEVHISRGTDYFHMKIDLYTRLLNVGKIIDTVM